jgi:hypothetical protein
MTKIFSLIFLVALLASCDSKKVSCYMKEGLEINQYNLKLKLTKMLALKYASEDYKKSKKDLWSISMTDEYKQFLKMNFDDAENETGKYFEKATETLADDSIVIEKIIPVAYNKEINKCDCEATMKIPGTKIEDKFQYDITRDGQGKLVGHYSYHPSLKIDGEKYDNLVHTLEDIAYERKDFEKPERTVSLLDKEKSWSLFWNEFKTAFNTKDKDKLVSLCSDGFFSGGSGDNPSEFFSYLFNEHEGYATTVKTLNKGAHDFTYPDGTKSKVTGVGDEEGDWYFEFKNGNWVFAGVVGD